MGEFADDVQRRLRDGLAAGCPTLDWETEYDIAGTPVDAFESVRSRPFDLDIDPPKRGGPRPDDWAATTDELAAPLVEAVANQK